VIGLKNLFRIRKYLCTGGSSTLGFLCCVSWYIVSYNCLPVTGHGITEDLHLQQHYSKGPKSLILAVSQSYIYLYIYLFTFH